MGETKDTYEVLYEQQSEPTKQKLSTLLENIKDRISSTPLSKLENAITGKATGTKIDFSELMGSIYAKRIAKDILMKQIVGNKNEKLTFFDKLTQKIGDKISDDILKQKNSYDAVLTQQEVLVTEQFKAELADLKSSITVGNAAADPTTLETTNNSSTTDTHEGYAERSHYTEEERKQINAVIAVAKTFEGTIYKYGGNGKKGIDCSGLWSAAFNKEYNDAGHTFGRLTAALFDTKAPDISRNDVEKGDWMFREDPKGLKEGGRNEKGMKIYHIEMVLGKPFEKDGKRYIKTYGSSSDTNMVDSYGNPLNNNKSGVGYRIREIKDNHHFAKPPYYEKLVAMKQGKEEHEVTT